MTRSKWILAASVVIALVAIALGLVIVGGPQQGRLDQHDENRFNDLTAMLEVLECHYRSEGDFPAQFEKQEIIAECRSIFPPEGDLTDAITNVPYSYTVQTSQRVSLCAPFESAPERLEILFAEIEPDFVAATGCITVIRD